MMSTQLLNSLTDTFDVGLQMSSVDGTYLHGYDLTLVICTVPCPTITCYHSDLPYYAILGIVTQDYNLLLLHHTGRGKPCSR